MVFKALDDGGMHAFQHIHYSVWPFDRAAKPIYFEGGAMIHFQRIEQTLCKESDNYKHTDPQRLKDIIWLAYFRVHD